MAETQAPTTSAVYKVTIRGTIRDVWREITKTDSVQQAMFNMRLHTTALRPGAPIRVRTKSGKYTPTAKVSERKPISSMNTAIATPIRIRSHGKRCSSKPSITTDMKEGGDVGDASSF